jgi:hypothetical protein
MAIWIKAEQVERVHGELLAMASEGARYVVFEPGQQQYGPMDFMPAKDEKELKVVMVMFEQGKVIEIGLLVAQLEKSMERGITDWAVLPDFAVMGLEQGNIFSDLRMMGLKEPALEALIYEAGERDYAEIGLDRKIGEVEVGLRLYRVDINGQPRIPEFAIVIPKVIDKVPFLKSEFGDSRSLESELKRTVTYAQQQGMVNGERVISTIAMATKAALFMGASWAADSDPEFGLRCEVVSTLLGRYPQGKEVSEVLLSMRPEYFKHLNTSISFPYTVKVNEVVKLINSPAEMMEISRRGFEHENLKKAIMNASNLEQLKLEMEKLGFSEQLIGKMEEHMSRNEPRFILYDVLEADKGRAEVALHFNQSKNSEFYYFNKFDLVLEKQPPLEAGEKYFVSSQRQGEEVLVREFEMPSLAVKLFNLKMEGAKDIRGTASILSGKDVGSAKVLVAMEDGKITSVEKDFYKTLKNPSVSQTFYLEKGNGFTVEQGLNLVQGRSVYREDLLDISKHEYSAWARLELDKPRDRSGNFEVHKIYEGYKFDFGAVLDRFALSELDKPKAREVLETSLKNGNRAEVTVDMDGKKEKLLAVVMPDFKQINLYSLDGEVIKREQHQKPEVIADVSLGKDKGQKKGQEQGLGV